MPTYSTTVRTWAAGDGTSTQFNAGVRDPINELRTMFGTGTSAAITTFTGSGVGVGTVTPRARRYGDRVFLEGNITDTNSTLAAGAIATLPAGYWPVSTCKFMCAGDSATWGQIAISTAGVLTLTLGTGTTPTNIYLDTITFVGA